MESELQLCLVGIFVVMYADGYVLSGRLLQIVEQREDELGAWSVSPAP